MENLNQLCIPRGPRLSNKARIMRALGARPGTAKSIAYKSGLTISQIQRRLPELQRDGCIEYVKAYDGVSDRVGGFRVFRATKFLVASAHF